SDQFQRFRETGLELDHVNGHLHFHMHPTVALFLFANVVDFEIRRMRLTSEPFWLNARVASGRWFYRISHAIIFRLLAKKYRTAFRDFGIKTTSQVFGLLQNGLVDEKYILSILPILPPGDS